MWCKGFIRNIPSLRVEGIALFPFILVKRKHNGAWLINHERIHLRQQLELGIVPFYVWYVLEYLVRLVQHKNRYLAYLHISFEKEAYANQSDLEYLEKRCLWAFRKYL